ncbi:DUF4124 domain-containing protein [Halopseudomonas sp.]|jgi:hypothetical protein|uniref:DUF4124 domain-containing protein n=1 Tax=Halopseudomonas sp. TaxID=2901191 RepID=UPI0039E50B5E
MLRNPMCWALAALLVSLTSFANAQIYTWTDEDGNTVYTDKPNPNARQIDLPPINTLESTIPKMPEELSTSSGQRDGQLNDGYNTLQITSPANDEGIRANDGNLTLVINTEPPLSPGHLLRASVDGNLQQAAVAGNGQPSQQITLPELDRGSHQIVAIVTNARGEEVQRSGAITVHIQRTSVLQPGRTNQNAAPQAPRPGGASAP